MRTWEYLIDSINFLTNDDERTLWLNERGREGWELVLVSEGGNRIRYTFKRPKGSS